VNETAVASANDSRFLEMADLSMMAASGARIKITKEMTSAIGLPFPLLSRRPPKNIMRVNMSETIAIAPAVVAATALTNVSRFATCAISWAITPCS